MEWVHFLVTWFWKFIDLFLHLDKYLNAVIMEYGTATYFFLFLVVFLETGLVVTPFLPGDSLLFAAGAFSASGSLSLSSVLGLLFVAAVIGDAVNYTIGFTVGKTLVKRGVIKPAHLKKINEFYAKYGTKTIVLARFVPIVRTIAPFLAGTGVMSYHKFFVYNVIGGALWVVICTLAGYFFGGIPVVKNNFTLVVLAIIFISVLPIAFEMWKSRKERNHANA